MKILKIDEIASKGAPLYDMKEVYNIVGKYENIKLSVISIDPGVRIPAEGTGYHQEDEYSIFLEGEVYTESGADKATVGKGMATLIPKDEKHWCENRTDKPCVLVCMLVK